MQNQPELVRNADGSINTAHYMARARQLRSAQAHKQMKAIANARRSAFATAKTWLSAKLATTPFAVQE